LSEVEEIKKEVVKTLGYRNWNDFVGSPFGNLACIRCIEISIKYFRKNYKLQWRID